MKGVEIKFTGMARTDLLAETSLDEDEIARVEAEAAENGKADFVLDAVVRRCRPNRLSHARALSATSPRGLEELSGLRAGAVVVRMLMFQLSSLERPGRS